MRDLPDYKKPPVVEVSAGLQFAPIEGLTGAHVGSYWRLIRKDFPRAEEQPPILHKVEVFGMVEGEAEPEVRISTRLPLPRTWLLSEDGTTLVQVQQDRFHYNWRNLEPVNDYPRYKNVKAAFFENWKTFCKFLSDEGLAPPQVDQCELVYINLIRKGEGWDTVADLSELFTASKWAARGQFLPDPEGVTWNARFVWPDGRTRMYVEQAPVRIKTDNSEAAQLRLIVRGSPETINDKSIDTWFDTAHTWIVEGFAALTDTRADELWERIA